MRYLSMTTYAKWIKLFKATALLQGFDWVLDETFQPQGGNQKELTVFELRQLTMFTILNTILRTSKGRDLLDIYGDNKDAQKILRELRIYQTESSVAKRRAHKILQKILSSTMVNGQCRESQIVTFKKLMRAYNSYTTNQLTDRKQTTYMNTFCSSSPGLGNIASLTHIVGGVAGVSISAEQEMAIIIEEQALMGD